MVDERSEEVKVTEFATNRVRGWTRIARGLLRSRRPK